MQCVLFCEGPSHPHIPVLDASHLSVYLCVTGVNKTSPEDMGYDYIVPGENGSRSDCQWTTFRSDKDGDGIRVTGLANTAKKGTGCSSYYSFSALLHSSGELHAATHTCDLKSRRNGDAPIHVNLDHDLMGVGGDVSWFPVVYDEFLVKPRDRFDYGVWLVPVRKGGDDAPDALP